MTRAFEQAATVPRRLIVVLLALALVALLLFAVVLASRQTGQGEAPPPPPPFAGFETHAFQRFAVRSVEGNRAVLVADTLPGQSTDTTRELDLAAVSIELLRPIAPSDIRTGEALSVVAVQNDVQNFSIRSLVIHTDSTPDADRLPRSRGGFAGYEASADAAERVVLTGIIVDATSEHLTLDTGAEQADITLIADTTIYRLETGDPRDISAGDRVALREAPAGVHILVLPGSPW